MNYKASMKHKSTSCTIDFSSLSYNYSGIPKIIQYKTKNSVNLDYRYYDSNSKNLFIILHGSGYHSRYLYKFAKNISEQNIAKVITPDLRGHGINPIKRGDIDYIGQLDDDLDDLIKFCIQKYQPEKLFVAGHSSGGGLALRLMGNKNRLQADGYILLAPYFSHNAATTNNNSGWAEASLFKVILAHTLNSMGLNWLDHCITVKFNLPKNYQDGTETLFYSHALVTSFSPIDYQKDLESTNKKTLIIIGEDDEAMNPKEYKKIIPSNSNHFKLNIMPNINHMNIIINQKTIDIIEKCLK